MVSSGLAQAIAEWEAALGASHVVRTPALLQQAATATFSTTGQVQAILRPGTREDVQACVRIANRHRVPLFPVSSGKNWGYGSRAPVRNGVLVELARLNRIVAFDEELAYVTIEPGVTQGQLHAFLRERRSGLWMDATGASPECSIVGNTMERGFGHTPMADHCGNACNFEVVLPNGDCVETGFNRFEGARTGPVSRWGVGASLDGLFSQSNLGIVTRMTVWLMPAPEHFEAFFFMTTKEEGIREIVDALRPLRLNGTLRSAIHIGNDYKVVTATTQFPWNDARVTPPLSGPSMAQLRQTLNIGFWNGAGGLYGTRAQVREARKQLKRALAGKVDRLQFVDDRLLRIMARFARPFSVLTKWDISKTLKVIAPVYNLLKGVPTDGALASAYWRKHEPPPATMDPDLDGCGLLWCSPVLPSTGADAVEVSRLASRILLEHGFEPQMSLSLATERSAICVTTISYDRKVDGEDARAMACYTALTDALVARGYPPYRLNVQSMAYAAGSASWGSAFGSLKAALDPNGIMAPGRYDPSPAPQFQPLVPQPVVTAR